MMSVSTIVLFFIAYSDLFLVNCSQILVENGVYSRVTVQIESQPQPQNCVDFLDKLEVSKSIFYTNTKIIQFKLRSINVLAIKMIRNKNDINQPC